MIQFWVKCDTETSIEYIFSSHPGYIFLHRHIYLIIKEKINNIMNN